VPTSLLDAVADAASTRLAKVVVGNPGDPSVRMGALASLDQREDVRRSLKALLAAGTAVFGDPDKVDVVGADAARGAFMSPVLVRAADAERAEPHEIEAFGPVSTLIGYDAGGRDAAGAAVELAVRGLGSLVGSIVTADADFARDVVVGVAPWHGRLLVLDRDDAAESTGHGSPLPMLVHGGPGRAGGGEELGGIRAVLHHMQRTAVQGSPRMLTAVTQRWTAGAERHTGEHPFRKHLEDLHVGDSVETAPRTVTLDDVTQFANFTGDTFYAHTDEKAAAANPFFGGLVAHGYLVLSFAAGLFVDPAPGPVLANYGLDNLRFVTPLKPDDEMRVTLTAKHITPRATEPYGEVRWDVLIVNQRDEIVATYELLTLVAKREEQPTVP
jgi:oxepin-CoA hydrolase/3-oxo-5,6-dehydrosuberyl-CoA semialdehyde dehydrogenase